MLSAFKKIFKYVFLLVIVTGFFQVLASSTNGTIDASNHSALLCMDDACTTTSRINFGYFENSSGTDITVTNSSLSGYMWGENFGWVVLNCSDTTSGCTSANDYFKVSNDGEGHLSGYAWGQNAGWVNFGPFLNNTANTVSINDSGEFDGYAWAQNFGWIKFDCSTPNACVKTDWRADDGGGSSGSTTGGDPTTVDVCPNIAGDQSSIPSGFVLNDLGNCVVLPIVLDFCEQNPTDPSCIPVVPDFCTENPSDPSCKQVEPTFCELNPSDPSCQNVDFCTTHPADPSCVEIEETFCNLHPSDPSCAAGTNNDCTGPNCNSLGGGDGNVDLSSILGDLTWSNAEELILGKIDFIKNIFTDSVGAVAAKVVSTAGVAASLSFGVVNVVFAGPLSFSEILMLPLRLWHLLLAGLGLRKRRSPWGTVYDSVTKQPLDPAYVVLQDLNGNEVATSITDLDGRYGFLVPKGQYRIIANKTNYEFPSKKLAGHTKDELYEDLYFNEIIEIKEDGEVITKNIPLDPVKFDWNEFAKKDKKLMKFFSRKQIIIAVVSDALFALGFIVAIIAALVSPIIYNIIILALYTLLYLLRGTILKPRAFGNIKESSTDYPLSFAVIRIFFPGSDHEVIHKVADKSGKYYCLVPNGNYYAKIENKNPDESYSLIHTSETIEVKKGYINKKFKI